MNVVNCQRRKLRSYSRTRHRDGLDYTGSAPIIWAEGSDPQSLIQSRCVFCGVSLPDDRLLCAVCHMDKEMIIERMRWASADVSTKSGFGNLRPTLFTLAVGAVLVPPVFMRAFRARWKGWRGVPDRIHQSGVKGGMRGGVPAGQSNPASHPFPSLSLWRALAKCPRARWRQVRTSST
jgi:hypothetical protein